jgi:hypothetical protein
VEIIFFLFCFCFCFWVWEIVFGDEGLKENPTNVHQEKFECIIWYNIISDFDQGTKAWPRNSDTREFSFWSFSSTSSHFQDFNYTLYQWKLQFQKVWIIGLSSKEPFSSTNCTFVQKITSDKHFWCFGLKVVSKLIILLKRKNFTYEMGIVLSYCQPTMGCLYTMYVCQQKYDQTHGFAYEDFWKNLEIIEKQQEV